MEDRYVAELTSDAFGEEDSFIIYDTKKDRYYINGDKSLVTFETEKEAENFCKALNENL